MPNGLYSVHPELVYSHNWMADRPEGQREKRERDGHFLQITNDAIRALSNPKDEKMGASVIYVFTQEQVNRIVSIARFEIEWHKVDFYYVLRRADNGR